MSALQRRPVDHLPVDRLDARIGQQHARIGHAVVLVDRQAATLQDHVLFVHPQRATPGVARRRTWAGFRCGRWAGSATRRRAPAAASEPAPGWRPASAYCLKASIVAVMCTVFGMPLSTREFMP